MVPEAGLEPARFLQPKDFKSFVSAYSTTRAYFGDPSETRTPDTLIKSQVLFLLS